MLINKVFVSEYFGVGVVISLVVSLTTLPALALSNDPIFFKDEYSENGKEDTCHLPSGQIGKCVNITDCSSRLAIIKDKQLICGWQTEGIPKVCCIDHTDIGDRNCTTTDNSPGYCVRFTQCQLIMSMVFNIPFDPETITYVKNNRCGIKKFDVCCASEHEEKQNDQISTENDQCNSSSTPPDHSSGCCGQDQYMVNRIIPGEIAEIDQYPWTAIIEYESNNSSVLGCGGALISGQYVLTTASCVYLAASKPINVHLGDFNITNSGLDCVEIPGGGLDCSPGAISIAIEKVIPHPNFDALSPAKANDIALVRMAEIVSFTDFIRPICLPAADITKTDTKDLKTIRLYVTGWGLTNDAPPHSDVKRIARLSFVSREDCFNLYSSNKVSLGEEHICAGGQEERSCKGDSGGALMLDRELYTEVVGLASFGSHPCGNMTGPAVYTNVYHYLKWIRKTIY